MATDRGGFRVAGIERPTPERSEPQREEPPIRTVIPIVFVPGIAGSNLRIREECEETVRARLQLPRKKPLPQAWHPPDGKGPAAIKAVNQWNKYLPSQRQALLNGETTRVDDDGFLDQGTEGINLSPFLPDGARFRGWDSIHWGSYGNFLQFLENEANPTDKKRTPSNDIPLEKQTESNLSAYLLHLVDSPFGRFSGQHIERNRLFRFRLPLDQVKNIKRNLMPVYASGYNWLESNQVSADHLLDNINKIIALYNDYKSIDGRPAYSCDKVILITHSMGGLVARAAFNKENQKIKGIIHGVMPAVGTPSAYRRMVAGTELDHTSKIPVLSHYLNGVSVIMGKDASETTPVLANNAGPLQLLPSTEYPPGWLQVAYPKANGNVDIIFKIPDSNPYEEIYKNKDAWYRLVEPNLIDPCGIHKMEKREPWETYIKKINEAEKFHNILKEGSIAPSYAYYGNDDSYQTWGTIRWFLTRVTTDPLNLGEDRIRIGHPFHACAGVSGPMMILPTQSQIKNANLIGCYNNGLTRMVAIYGAREDGLRTILGFQLQGKDARPTTPRGATMAESLMGSAASRSKGN